MSKCAHFAHYLGCRRPDPLQDHIATLVDYCNDPGVRNTPKGNSSYFMAFSLYIISSCWKKMWRRVSRWSSQGFVYALARLKDGAIQAAYNAYTTKEDPHYSAQRDSPLVQLVTSMDFGALQAIMSHYRHPGQDGPKSPNDLLFSTFNKAKGGEVDRIYKQDTCIAFHHLLIAVLLAYSDLLWELKGISEKDKGDKQGKDGKDREEGKDGKQRDPAEVMKELLECSNLLWKISDSKMLEHHIQTLRQTNLPLPEEDQKKMYSAFLGHPHLALELDSDLEDQLVPEESGSAHTKLHHWIRLQSSPLEALHLMDSHCCGRKRPSPPIEISLIAVKVPNLKALKMENWEKTFEKLVQVCPRGMNPPTNALDVKKAQELLSGLKAPSSGDKSIFHGTVPHCEALLALLIIYYCTGGGANSTNSELVKLLQVGPALTLIIPNANKFNSQSLDRATIAVSKLCCPICWELMAVLNALLNGFKVRGRHPTLFRTLLPVFCPVDVLQEMVNRLQDHLYKELLVRTKEGDGKAKVKHTRSPSLQSDDGFEHSVNTGRIIIQGGHDKHEELVGAEADEASLKVDWGGDYATEEFGSDRKEEEYEGMSGWVGSLDDSGEFDNDSSSDGEQDTSDYCVRLTLDTD
jgi:hypothetical protein